MMVFIAMTPITGSEHLGNSTSQKDRPLQNETEMKCFVQKRWRQCLLLTIALSVVFLLRDAVLIVIN